MQIERERGRKRSSQTHTVLPNHNNNRNHNHNNHNNDDNRMEKGFEWVARGYGKDHVKLLYVRREGRVHSIKEYEIKTQLTLNTDKDYLMGDNSDVIATDSQKNTVYILAKRHGVCILCSIVMLRTLSIVLHCLKFSL